MRATSIFFLFNFIQRKCKYFQLVVDKLFTSSIRALVWKYKKLTGGITYTNEKLITIITK